MAILNAFSGSTIGKSMQVNVDILGGVSYNASNGSYSGLPTKATLSSVAEQKQYLSSSFGTDAGTIIQALNHLKAQSSAVSPAGVSGSIQLRNADGSGFTYEGGLKATHTEMYVPGKLNITGAMEIAGDADLNGALDVAGLTTFSDKVTVSPGAGDGITSTGALAMYVPTGANDISLGMGDAVGAQAVHFKTNAGTTVAYINSNGAISASAGLQVGGTSDFDGAVNLDAGLTVAGASALQAVTATTISGSGNLQVGGTSDFDGAVNLDAGLTVLGASALQAVTATTISGSGRADIKGILQVGGAIDANSSSNFAGAMVLQSTLQVGGAIDANSSSNFQGAMVLQSTLDVEGATVLGAATRISGAAGDYAAIPVFSIQGTDSTGAVDDFQLVVSGGILRALAI